MKMQTRSWVGDCVPVLPAIWEAKSRGSLEERGQRENPGQGEPQTL
jgi:hypothetical protein